MAFQFKKFNIEDDRSSMKVGTDAVILGAWAKIESGGRILDIGTGSGVIALMLAQRSKGNIIDAVEIDTGSVLQAKQNVQSSPWSNRINVIHGKFQDYCKLAESKYDLIVSNPPFFEKALKPKDIKKRLSRHTENLPHNKLLAGVSHLLSKDGRFVVILPFLNSRNFKETAWLENLSPIRELEVYPLADEMPRRVIYEFTREKAKCIKEKLYLREGDGSYTAEYKALTSGFYLNF